MEYLSAKALGLVFLVLSLFSLDVVSVTLGSPTQAPGFAPSFSPWAPPSIDCGSACAVRCSLSPRPNLCHRACGTCCARCSCVPSGTSGHYEECPCYANMTTRDGKRKCP